MLLPFQDASLPLTTLLQVHGIGMQFSPVHFGRSKLLWVRFYTLIIGWLLLSLPSHCLKFQTTFDTLNCNLGTLAIGLGCFPLDRQTYSGSLTPALIPVNSEFDKMAGDLSP